VADVNLFSTYRLLLKNKVQAQGISTYLMNKNKRSIIIDTQTKNNKQKYFGFRYRNRSCLSKIQKLKLN